MNIRLFITATLLTAVTCALLFHFGCIWYYGKFLIAEPNKVVLIVETIGILAILGWGIAQLVRELK